MAIAIEQSDNTLRVNKDRYDLGRIVGVQVKALGWMDRLKKTFLLGVVTSSVLFYFTPSYEQAGNWLIVLFLPLVGFLSGALMGLISSAKYEFCIEFSHVTRRACSGSPPPGVGMSPIMRPSRRRRPG